MAELSPSLGKRTPDVSGSSLRGWTASAGSGARASQASREDIDRSGGGSTSSFTSTQALQGPQAYRGNSWTQPSVGTSRILGATQLGAPTRGSYLHGQLGPASGSGPVLSSAASVGQGARSTSSDTAPGAATGVDEQIKSERRWWQEHLLQEVARIEATVSKEISKSTSALREHVQRQMEVERADGIQRVSTLERSVSRIREDVDGMRQTHQQPAAPASVDQGGWPLALADAARRTGDAISQSEAALRLELRGVQARLEDDQRQHREELSMALAKAQTAMEGVGQQLHLGQDRLSEDLRALKERLASAEHDHRMAEARLEQAHIVSAARLERLERLEAQPTGAAVASGGGSSPSTQGIGADVIKEEVRRAVTQELVQTIESTSTKHSADIESLREALRKNSQDFLESLASERHKRESDLEEVKASALEMAREDEQRRQGGSSEALELASFLEAECQARKSDVEELKRLLDQVPVGRLQQSVEDMDDRVSSLVSAMEAEREARRTDSERHQMSVTDLMDALRAERVLRTSEATRLRQALADLALNMNSALNEELALRGSEGLTQAITGLQTVLEEETLQSAAHQEELAGNSVGSQLVSGVVAASSRDRRALEAEAHRSDRSAALGREATELLTQLGGRIRALGEELRAETSQQVESANISLRKEMEMRLEVVGAEIRGEFVTSYAELKSDIASSCQDLRAQLTAQFSASRATVVRADGSAGSGQVLQSSAAAVGQLREVLRLMQVMEALAEKICSEASTRKATEAQLEFRVAGVERQLALGCGLEGAGGLEQALAGGLEQEPLQLRQQALSVSPATTSGSLAPTVTTVAATVAGSSVQPRGAQIQQQLQAQSVISDDLKDTLEKLVDRVNTMLKADDGTAQPAPVAPPVHNFYGGVHHQQSYIAVGAGAPAAPTPAARSGGAPAGVLSNSHARQASQSPERPQQSEPAPALHGGTSLEIPGQRAPGQPAVDQQVTRRSQIGVDRHVSVSSSLHSTTMTPSRSSMLGASHVAHDEAKGFTPGAPSPAYETLASPSISAQRTPASTPGGVLQTVRPVSTPGGASSVGGRSATKEGELSREALLQKAMQEMPQLQQENQALRGQLQASGGQLTGSVSFNTGATPGNRAFATTVTQRAVAHKDLPSSPRELGQQQQAQVVNPQLQQALWGQPSQAAQQPALMMHHPMGAHTVAQPNAPMQTPLRPAAVMPGGAYVRPMAPQSYIAGRGSM